MKVTSTTTDSQIPQSQTNSALKNNTKHLARITTHARMDHFTTCVLIATSLVLPWRAPSWTSGGPKYFIQCVLRDIRASWLKNLIISFNKIWKPPRRDIGYFKYWRNFWTGAHPYFTLLADRFFTYINKIGSSVRPVHTPYLYNWGLFRLKSKVQQFVGLGAQIIKYFLALK